MLEKSIIQAAVDLNKIVESSCYELSQIVSAKTDLPYVISLYARFMLAYYQSEIPIMQKLIEDYSKQSEQYEYVLTLLKLRLSVRNNEESKPFILKLIQMTPASKVWECEALYVTGYYYGRKQDHMNAKKYFLQAHHQYLAIGALNKAERSYANYLNARQWINEKVGTSELITSFKMFRNSKNSSFLGLLALNISYSFSYIGATSICMHFAEISEKYLKSNFGQLDYELCIAWLAYLKKDLNEKRSSELMSVLGNSRLEETKQILLFLLNKPEQINSSLLPNFWLNLFKSKKNIYRLSEQEQQLIFCILFESKEKQQLVEILYAQELENKIDSSHLNKRLETLIYRIRKKYPGLIVHRDGKYKFGELNV